MKNKYKHYVEKVYRGSDTGENRSVVEETICEDPLLISPDKDLIGFRFFDARAIEEDGRVILKSKNNISPMYYFGQRVNVDDPEGIYCSVDLMISYLKTHGLDSAIFCKCGEIIKQIPKGAKTIKEVSEEVKKKIGEQYVFDEGDFFNGLASCLECMGGKVTLTVSDSFWPVTDDIDLGDDEEVAVVRTYCIYDDEFEVVQKHTVLGTDDLGDSRVKSYLDLNQVMSIVEPLYQEYPALSSIMSKVRVEVFANGCGDISNKMINAAIDTLANGDAYKTAVVYEKSRKHE